VVGYHGAVEVLDQNIQTVLDALDTTGEADNTSVIYTSDHGGNPGDSPHPGSCGLYEESTRVPFIVAGPDPAKGSTITDAVGGINLYPTVAEVVGVDQPPELRGVSLKGLAMGGIGRQINPATRSASCTRPHSWEADSPIARITGRRNSLRVVSSSRSWTSVAAGGIQSGSSRDRMSSFLRPKTQYRNLSHASPRIILPSSSFLYYPVPSS
tara:strand:+ start:1170 stop:1802 length:633 start_codon:yes stop_codon:yes gene_type:complete